MNFKIILLLSIFAILEAAEIKGLKRIKRDNELKAKKSIDHDFVVLRTDKNDPMENLKKNDYKVLDSDAGSKNLTSDSNIKDRIFNRPLAVILHEREGQNDERREPDDDSHDAGVHGADNSEHFMGKHCNADRVSKDRFKSGKNRHMPHILHSTGVVEAKVVIPPQPIEFNSLASLEQLMNMMFKVGMDSLPYNANSPKKTTGQNTPYIYGKEPYYQTRSDPSLDYIYNSIEEPRTNYMGIQTPLPYNNRNLDDNLLTHAIIYKPPTTYKEPTPFANLMQTALDSMLVGNDDEDDDKSEGEIELRCPIHHEKQSSLHGKDNEDVIQVCSCRLIKKPKEEDSKKIK